jgi:Gas vesicle protein
MSNQIEFGRTRPTGLVEVLDRVLDKGLFVGGDIKISLAEVELLTIRIRLIVCSLDKAREIGLDWWMYDRHLSPGRTAMAERDQLEQRIVALEQQLGAAAVVPGIEASIEVRPPRARPLRKGAPRAKRPGGRR